MAIKIKVIHFFALKTSPILRWIRQRLCRHVFYLRDMQPRSAFGMGMIKWPCSKCGKVFEEHAGYYIFRDWQLKVD